MMISGSKVQKVVRACTIRFLNLGPAKHEKAAIYAVNQRISNLIIYSFYSCSKETLYDIISGQQLENDFTKKFRRQKGNGTEN